MTTFYLMRHGAPQYDMGEERRLIGGFRDLVPLTDIGIAQVEARVEQLRPLNADLILSSPMTRSLQTAAILSRALDLPIDVQFDLHEWMPDTTFNYDTAAQIFTAYDEMMKHTGEWPPGQTRNWEPLSAVRERVTAVLQQYTQHDTIIVTCHAAVILALTGDILDMAEFIKYQLFDLDLKIHELPD
jgi:broad specificity phosphatase PhoE